MSRPRLLDLFCGAGGAAMGYHRAGFDVVGVDINPQPHYPFEFHQGDAMTWPLDGFDAIHASPPCQAYSIMRNLPWLAGREYWDSVPPTLERLRNVSVPWVVENVRGAPLDGIMLCGQMFGLRLSHGDPVYKHRLFQSSQFMLAPGHPKHIEVLQGGSLLGDRGNISGRGRPQRTRGRTRERPGGTLSLDWMTQIERAQAIPPAYTEWIGAQLLAALKVSA